MTKTFHVLIIDDNSTIHDDFKKIFLKSSDLEKELDFFESSLFAQPEKEQKQDIFIIDSAYQGQEGIDCVRQAKKENKEYALAFVDIRMPPGLDGIKTIEGIWKEDPYIQIVICTAYSDYTWHEIFEKFPETDQLLILKKPFDTMEVHQLASALTKKWLLARQVSTQMDHLNNLVYQKTQELEKSLSLVQATIESTVEGILVMDLNNRITLYNKNFLDLWNLPSQFSDLNEGIALFQMLSNVLVDPEKFMRVARHLFHKPNATHADEISFSDHRWFEYYSGPQYQQKEIIGRIWSFRDVTQKKKMEADLAFQATHDTLTGLPNRILLIDHIRLYTSQAKRKQKMAVLFLIDISRFEAINDLYGFHTGDRVLKIISQRLSGFLREVDTIARIGGDEFAIFLKDIENETDIVGTVHHLMTKLTQIYQVDGHEFSLTAHMGICFFPRDADTPEVLLKNAGIALHRAKRKNGRGYQFYDSDMDQKMNYRFSLDFALYKALDKGEFSLSFQPIIDSKTESIYGVETLLNWNSSDFGRVAPSEFIEIAENNGTIVPIGEWVLSSACAQYKRWQQNGTMRSQRLAINVSGVQLKHGDFLNSFKKIINQTQMDPKLIEIELTETELMLDIDQILLILKNLKELGVTIAIDDFGTGYSSLNYLKKLPIDVIKIDQSFIKNIQLDIVDRKIIQSIINICHARRFQVVAEGVEHREQFDFLKESACDFVQGFFFSPPVTGDEIERMIQEKLKHTSI